MSVKASRKSNALRRVHRGNLPRLTQNDTERRSMAQLKNELDQDGAFSLAMTPNFINPMMIFADMTRRFLEGLVTAQKDWAGFIQHRAREDAALARQLANS